MGPLGMRFRYLRDPVFLICGAAYCLNRLVLKHLWSLGFFHDHLNDLICIPFLVPPMLYAQRKAGWRTHDEPPRAFEMLFPLLLWSCLFEVVLPITAPWGALTVPDYTDVVWYAVGSFAAGIVWRGFYNPFVARRALAAFTAQVANADEARLR